MSILLLVIGIIIVVFGVLLEKTYRFEEMGFFTIVIGGLFSFICFSGVVILAMTVAENSVIDEKIAMYQEENINIESQINELVTNYMEYESDTFKEFKSESSITLVSLYPELKSDTLVQSQVTTYTENNDKIKELKEELIMRKVYKWWLYFGGDKINDI